MTAGTHAERVQQLVSANLQLAIGYDATCCAAAGARGSLVMLSPTFLKASSTQKHSAGPQYRE